MIILNIIYLLFALSLHLATHPFANCGAKVQHFLQCTKYFLYFCRKFRHMCLIFKKYLEIKRAF